MRDPAARGRWSDMTGVKGRTVAVVVASGVAFSLAALTGGMVVPASAFRTTRAWPHSHLSWYFILSVLFTLKLR